MVMSAFKSDFKLGGMRALHRGPLKDENCKKSFVVRFRRARRRGAEGFGGARHPPPEQPPALPLRAPDPLRLLLSTVPSKLLPFAINLV